MSSASVHSQHLIIIASQNIPHLAKILKLFFPGEEANSVMQGEGGNICHYQIDGHKPVYQITAV